MKDLTQFMSDEESHRLFAGSCRKITVHQKSSFTNNDETPIFHGSYKNINVI